MATIHGGITRASTYWVTNPLPLDTKTVFDSLEQALNLIPGSHRFKGQKFAVKGEEGEKPIEYWFVEDFKAGGWFEIDGEWVELPDTIPQPVLYQPGGGELPPLSGETVMASLDPNFSYKSFDKVVTDIVFVKSGQKAALPLLMV